MDHIHYLYGGWSGCPGTGIEDQFGPHVVFSCGERFLVIYFFHGFNPLAYISSAWC
jgi:hypothetical protein